MANPRKDKQTFIEQARKVHGNKYDYSRVEYISNKSKVCIACPVHGEFWQTPTNHLHGQGCKLCGYEERKVVRHGKYVVDAIYVRSERAYNVWCKIIDRCEATTEKLRAYKGCSICQEWQTYSVFRDWYNANAVPGYHLDKDLLGTPGMKIYSPQTCCFLPPEINLLISVQKRQKRTLPVGVYRNGKKFRAQLAEEGLSEAFDTPEEAHCAYVVAKLKRIRRVAQQYFADGKITERVYAALISYNPSKLEYFNNR